MAIKVSQATIDKIKKMGMTKALASAKGGSAEFKEGLRRMYGAKRLQKAMGGMGSSSKKISAPVGTGARQVKSRSQNRNTPGSPAGTGARQTANRKPSNNRVAGPNSIRPGSPLDKLTKPKVMGKTAAQQRAGESKTTRGVLTSKDGKRIPRSEMTPKQRRVYDLRMGAPKGNRSKLTLSPKAGQKNLDKYYGKK